MSSGGTSQPFGFPAAVLTKERGPPVVVVITGRPHDIASRNTNPKGSPTEGAANRSAQDSPSGSS